MGRTVPTYRMTLESLVHELADYRRALRQEDREAFDALMAKARLHASASGYQTCLDTAESLLLSILIELEKETGRLRRELERVGR